MIAVFEVEFDPALMFDEQSIKDEFDGNWLKAMRWLYDQESIGIFDTDKLKLVDIIEVMETAPTQTNSEAKE